MSPPLPESTEEAACIASSLILGVGSVARVPSFAGNRVFRVTSRGGTRFLKFGSAPDLAREHAAIRTAGAAGVPVPEITVFDDEGTLSPHPLLVLEEVAGSASEGTEPWFASAASELMARLHSVCLDGFGATIASESGDLRGESDSWIGALHERAVSAVPAADAGLLPPHLVDHVVDAVASHRATVGLEQGRFLHGDFHPRHVYASGGAVTALIDWGDATSGDPDYDLARLLHAAVLRDHSRSPATAARDLVGAAAEPDGDRVTKLLLYAAVFLCSSMAGELAAGSPWPPWWPIQTDVLAELLTALGRLRPPA